MPRLKMVTANKFFYPVLRKLIDFHCLQGAKIPQSSRCPSQVHSLLSPVVLLESQAEKTTQDSNLQVSRKGHIYLLSIRRHAIEEKGIMQGAIPNCFKPIESPGKKYNKSSTVGSSASLSSVSAKHFFLDITQYDCYGPQWLALLIRELSLLSQDYFY